MSRLYKDRYRRGAQAIRASIRRVRLAGRFTDGPATSRGGRPIRPAPPRTLAAVALATTGEGKRAFQRLDPQGRVASDRPHLRPLEQGRPEGTAPLPFPPVRQLSKNRALGLPRPILGLPGAFFPVRPPFSSARRLSCVPHRFFCSPERHPAFPCGPSSLPGLPSRVRGGISASRVVILLIHATGQRKNRHPAFRTVHPRSGSPHPGLEARCPGLEA